VYVCVCACCGGRVGWQARGCDWVAGLGWRTAPPTAAAVRPRRRKPGMGGRASRTELQDIPFGMLVLEVLLDATAGAGVDRGGAGVLRVWNHGGGWRA
jgi:hypothetical protein